MKTILHLFNRIAGFSSLRPRDNKTFKSPHRYLPFGFASETSDDENPDWSNLASQLQKNLDNNQLGKIIELTAHLGQQIDTVKASNDSLERKNISHICQIIGYANRCAARREEAESWFKKALKFNINNNKAEQGLSSILAEKGEASMDVSFIANPTMKY